MKKELEQTERRAREKKALEKQVHDLEEAKKKDDGVIAKLQSDLLKLFELRVQDIKAFESELEKSQQALQHAEHYCAGRFKFFSEKLSGECLVFPRYLLHFPLFYHAGQPLFMKYMGLTLKQREIAWTNLAKS